MDSMDRKYANKIEDDLIGFGLKISFPNHVLTGIGLASVNIWNGNEVRGACKYFTIPEYTTVKPSPGDMQWIPPDYDFSERDIYVEVEATDRINVAFKEMYEREAGAKVSYEYRESVFDVWENRSKPIINWNFKKLKKQMEKHGSGSSALLNEVRKLGMEDRLMRGRISFGTPM